MQEILLKENERIDDLQLDGLKIIQNSKEFCFGIDSVLLSDFAKDSKNKNGTIVDLCTGSGVIAILLSSKTNSKKIIGVEIVEQISEMAQRSVKLNNLEDKIEIINEDLTKLGNTITSR